MKFPELEFDIGVACDQGEQDSVCVVVVHETQGEGLAGGLSALKSGPGSAHEIGGWDGDRLRRIMLSAVDRILCHTGGQNTNTVGYEKTGLSWWKKAFRLASKKERINIALAAHETARMLRREGLKARYLSVKMLRTQPHVSYLRGWTYHRNCSLAYGTTNHTDPGILGVSWPHRRFDLLVRYYWHHPHVHRTVSMKEARRWRRARRKDHV